MLLDDAIADGQAQAQTRAFAHQFGGEKRIEDAQQVLGGDAWTVVAHAQPGTLMMGLSVMTLWIGVA